MDDTKDWTWVLEQICPECGFVSGSVERDEIGTTARSVARTFAEALGGADVRRRPDPQTWSVLEYGCHVRDVFGVMDGRFEAMVDHDGAHFENWDQDATAIEDRYENQDPDAVAIEVVAAGDAVARRLAGIEVDQWAHRGLRSNGSAFTIESLGRYMVHDLVHHVWDIRRTPTR